LRLSTGINLLLIPPFNFQNSIPPKSILFILCDPQILIPFLLPQNTSARNYVITSCVFQLNEKHGPKIKIALATKLERISWLPFMWLNVRVKGQETTMGNNGNIVVAE
jgi:hypothetical protein